MTINVDNDKELLLKDLCARLSYGVICQVDDGAAGLNDGKLVEIDLSKGLVRFDADYYWEAYIDDIKPYLRPISSMTEEEAVEIDSMGFAYWTTMINNDLRSRGPMSLLDAIITHHKMVKLIDWLNAHHFDYRGLIERGLAIDATGLEIY